MALQTETIYCLINSAFIADTETDKIILEFMFIADADAAVLCSSQGAS